MLDLLKKVDWHVEILWIILILYLADTVAYYF